MPPSRLIDSRTSARLFFDRERAIMVRVVWLALLSLIGIGTIAATMIARGAGTPPPAAIAVEKPLAQTTVGSSSSQDTLTKADRLEITYREIISAQPITSLEPSPPDGASVSSKQPAKLISRHWQDPNAAKVAVVRPKPRPKNADKNIEKNTDKSTEKSADKKAAKPDRPRIAVDAKPCRPNAFGSLLRALNIAPGCET